MAERIIVAMSGGVDSSVAAFRLKSQGYDVIGVTLHLWDYPDTGEVKGRCCAPEDVHDARRVADHLGFPHYAFDRRELFEREVVSPFVEGYLAGQTPSPCVRCNRGVKISELLKLADRLGAKRVATGHYARLGSTPSGPVLLRALDRSKDQSYFLHMFGPEILSRLCFPLGQAEKREVREQAMSLQLCGAEKGESQELCFVPTGRYDAFIRERAQGRLRPGPIIDEAGRHVGVHAGISGYTIGQRRKLGVATGKRSYVVDVDRESNRVQLGSQDELYYSGALLGSACLRSESRLPLSCDVQVRYRGQPSRAVVHPVSAGQLRVEFVEPAFAVTPGQYAVFYDQDRVLGGGVIVEGVRQRTTPPRGPGGELRTNEDNSAPV